MCRKKVAILQSNYIPWRGYFDIINMVDEFVFYDDLQYTSRNWRNRNSIKTSHGLKWLTIPCGVSRSRLICEVELKDEHWQYKHWQSIFLNYKKATYFNIYSSFFEDFYLNNTWTNLTELNHYLIKAIAKDILGIQTKFIDSRQFDCKFRKEERVFEILDKTKATHYLSGPAAKEYLHEEKFRNRGIELEWMDYSNYPEYSQLYPPFEHRVSIIDLIFNEGPNAKRFMKSFGYEDE